MDPGTSFALSTKPRPAARGTSLKTPPHGLAVARIFIGGGGARSALWLQIHADVLKQPVHLTRETTPAAPSPSR
ncbi:MAG: FGGY-family carbohydrate kinase [Isosphaeraceae bacterium]